MAESKYLLIVYSYKQTAAAEQHVRYFLTVKKNTPVDGRVLCYALAGDLIDIALAAVYNVPAQAVGYCSAAAQSQQICPS